jgi:hypothetical protein
MMRASVNARALLIGFVALTVAAGLAMPGSGGAVGVGSATARATGSAKTYFVLGQQLVAVPAPRATIKGAIARLIAGPSTIEIRKGVRSFIPKSTKLEAASRAGHTATVDLGSALANGNAEARTARLAQLVFTVSSVTGITSVLVRIDGRAPAPGLFPRFDLTRPVTRAEITRPKVELPKYPAPRLGPPSPVTRKLQQRLAALGYLPANRVDGRPGLETTFAVIAFQKWTGLPRDGVAGPATTRALATAERPLPIVPRRADPSCVARMRTRPALRRAAALQIWLPADPRQGNREVDLRRRKQRRCSPGQRRSPRTFQHGERTRG